MPKSPDAPEEASVATRRQAMQVKPVVASRAFEGIAAQLRAHIMGGGVKVGDRLPVERDLAAQFQVSRSTLREALRALELSGLIELRKGAAGGAFVTGGNSKVIKGGLVDLYHLGAVTPIHLTEARVGLTHAIVSIACERITDAELDALERNVEEAERAHAAGDFHARTAHHQAFHMLLVQATRNPILIANMEGVMEIVRQFVLAIGAVDAINVLPSRRRLLKLLRQRDAAGATAEMVGSLERLHKRYLLLWGRTEDARLAAAQSGSPT